MHFEFERNLPALHMFENHAFHVATIASMKITKHAKFGSDMQSPATYADKFGPAGGLGLALESPFGRESRPPPHLTLYHDSGHARNFAKVYSGIGC